MAGYFITFEGVDYSGKSTQAKLLAEALTQAGYPVLLTREPGGSPIGSRIRDLLLDPDAKLDPYAELFLFLADRAHHVHHVLTPALTAGKIVICDRYIDSTLAYQGYGKGLPIDFIQQLNMIASRNVVPDLTFFLDIYEDEVRRRQQQRNNTVTPDQYDQASANFREQLIRGYWGAVEADPQRFHVLNAEYERQDLHEEIFCITQQKLRAHGLFQKGAA